MQAVLLAGVRNLVGDMLVEEEVAHHCGCPNEMDGWVVLKDANSILLPALMTKYYL
jgi:hypothetical protein